MNARNEFLAMTADTIGVDLLSALVQEIKLLPDVWPKLSQGKQEDILTRLRSRVATNVRMAVHILASEGRTTVVGALEQITIKDGAKAVIKVGRGAESLHELYDAQGKAVLVVVADAAEHTGGMDDVHGEPDQRAMDLGHEYHDNDGGGMDEGQGEARGEVIDAQPPALPAPGETAVTDAERDEAWESGYRAAEGGEPENACPVLCSELCIEWVKGWKAFHEQSEATAEA